MGIKLAISTGARERQWIRKYVPFQPHQMNHCSESKLRNHGRPLFSDEISIEDSKKKMTTMAADRK